jgi:hypothetical protein
MPSFGNSITLGFSPRRPIDFGSRTHDASEKVVVANIP